MNKNNSIYKVLCSGIEYETKFRIGQRVEKKSYTKIMIIESVDEFLTSASNKLHWELVDEDYVLGITKSTYAESASDDELYSL